MYTLDSPVTVLKGVGSKTAAVFGRAGIKTLGDLLEYYPVRYVKYEEPGKFQKPQTGRSLPSVAFWNEDFPYGTSKKCRLLPASSSVERTGFRSVGLT